jgi:hypothetical protein
MLDNINYGTGIDSAIKNIAEKPAQSIGTTFNDIWFLIFGGISEKAEKKRLQVAKNIEDFRNELHEKTEQIPNEKRIDPDFQTVSLSLENAKFSINVKEIRDMFSTLVASSMNSDLSGFVHPSFAEMIKQMSPLDAKIAKQILSTRSFPVVKIRRQAKSTPRFKENGFEHFKYFNSGVDLASHLTLISDIDDVSDIPPCLNNLERLGLIQISYETFFVDPTRYAEIQKKLQLLSYEVPEQEDMEIAYIPGSITVTPLGHDFASVCF